MHIRDVPTISVESKHPAGTIGIYTDHIARFSDFTVSIISLLTPPGTVYSWARGVYLAYNTNRFIRELEGDWLFLMDDDHRFDPDILMNLLDHELDVVVALTCKKFPPYEPVLYEGNDVEESEGAFSVGTKGDVPIDLTGLSGLIEVSACGKPGMLIRKHVLDAMSDPWYEFKNNEQRAEDFDFYNKIRTAGFKIYADLDLALGHMAPYTVTKVRDVECKWRSMLAIGGDGGVLLPDHLRRK